MSIGGQQNIEFRDLIHYQQKSNEKLKEEAKNFFLSEHFMVGPGENEDKRKHYQLLQMYLCTTNCEVIDWVNRKTHGLLPNTDYNEYDAPELKINVGYVKNVTNNYFNQGDFDWDSVEW